MQAAADKFSGCSASPSSDVDRERNIVRIEQQVRIVDNVLCFVPPKRGKDARGADR